MKKKAAAQEFDLNQLRAYMAMSAREKLRFLEEMRGFLSKAMPSKSKAAWAKLKARGW